MLQIAEKKKLKKIESTLKNLASRRRQGVEGNRAYFDTLRESIHLYENVVCRCRRQAVVPAGNEYNRLKRLTARAIGENGGQAEPASVSLKQYDHIRYGPFLGVSDEGSSTDRVAAAALDSPKMQVIGDDVRPLDVGVSLDAERLAAIGEVAVGPEEYRKIRLGCIGRILTSTNVGTRLNLRYYKERPKIEVSTGSVKAMAEQVIQEATVILESFLITPDGDPRKLTVFIHFSGRPGREHRLQLLKALQAVFEKGRFCDPSIHKLGLLANVPRGEKGVRAVKQHIDLVKEAGIKELAVEGVVRSKAQELISLPDLLSFFRPEQVTEILTCAADKRIMLTPWHLVDPDTVARHVWAPLQVAHNMGLELGKYGLFPLTLEQSDLIMGMMQSWFSSWTAAPALYLDFPIVDRKRVYTEENIMRGMKRWLRLVANHNIPVVLIDTADKSKGRKLLKKSEKDKVGILHLKQIREIEAEAKKLGVRVLWAGGLTLPQAYDMGRLQVFGIYVTTAVSASTPVTGAYRRDPMLPSAKEPTFEGVSRVKLLLESGFLVTRLRDLGYETESKEIERAAELLIAVLQKRKNHHKELALSSHIALSKLAVGAWRIVLKQRASAV